MELSLRGRTALVTGAAQGIGRAIAIEFARAGADIAICDRDDEGLRSTASAIEETGRKAISGLFDVRDGAAAAAFVAEVVGVTGTIELLVNNAGGGFVADFMDVNEKGEDALIRENFTSVTAMIRLVAPLMPESGGAIINITSAGANLPRPPGPDWQLPEGRTYVGYGITKAALNRWVAGVAGELRLRNIAIVAVDPGRTVVERNIANPIAGVDYSTANMPEMTGRAVVFICQDAMAYTGRVVESKELVDQNTLKMIGMTPRKQS